MKKDIHPKYYPEARVVCTCGNTWTVGSTVPEIRTDVCSVCHPFFTGEQRIVDTAGQVERFRQRLAKSLGSDETPKADEAKTAAPTPGKQRGVKATPVSRKATRATEAKSAEE